MTAICADDFTQLTTPHLPRLMRLGMRLTHQSSESQDLVQEALCRAWKHRDSFRSGSSVGAWLSRIVMNTFISRRRHERVVSQTAARPDLPSCLFDGHRMMAARDPEGAMTFHELGDEVRDALDALPARYREVVVLIDLEGLPYADAAERLGIPPGTVMSRLHRARRRLRTALAEYRN